MRKTNRILRAACLVCACCVAVSCSMALSGCAGDGSGARQDQAVNGAHEEAAGQADAEAAQQMATEQGSEETARRNPGTQESSGQGSEEAAPGTQASAGQAPSEPQIMEADWSGYFDGLNGAAVLYDPSEMRYTVYNIEAAQTRRSPCSTFKIISSLAALECGVIDPSDSVRTWSGERFWNEDWNRDIGFEDAFRASCVWYFREVTDEIGPERMQAQLDALSYGNCDMSDWEGRLNTSNGNRALTGFWIESSLAISPMEQTQVMERIFGDGSAYSVETTDVLRQVMFIQKQDRTDRSVYGKTGMGKADGITVDAWFTGFADGDEGPVYFCVWLGRTDGRDVTSAAARDIAIRIVSDYTGSDDITDNL